MSEITFSELNLLPEIQRAIDEMGFETPTDIQAQAIPLLRDLLQLCRMRLPDRRDFSD